MLPLTAKAQAAARAINVKPNLVLKIDGLDYLFGVANVSEYIRIGDPGLLIGSYNGEPWYIGGLRDSGNQAALISFQNGTTTKVTLQLDADKGTGSSVANFTVNIVDKNELVTRLIAPGFVLDDIMAKGCRIMLGFQGTAFPTDYITIFRGVIEDVQSGAGTVIINTSSTDQKKRQKLFKKINSKLVTPISDIGAITTIDVQDASEFWTPSADPSFECFVRINDEFFKYTGVSTNTLTGVTRNASPLNYGQGAHAANDDVEFYYRLYGNGLDLARKLMLSGWDTTPSVEDIVVTNFVRISPTETVPNALFFFDRQIVDELGITVGDYVSTSGATNPANNFSNRQVTDIQFTEDGSYIVVDGAALVEENNTAGLMELSSQWNTLPFGLKMKPDDVDLAEFINQYNQYLSADIFDFRINDEQEGKEFLEREIFFPMSAFSVPRKARSSIGIHAGPLPNADILVLSSANVENADQLKVRRSLSKNFCNQVTFNYDWDVLTETFKTTKNRPEPGDMTDRLVENIGDRPIIINSKGIRTADSGATRSQLSSNRFLNRYRRGAEYIDNVEVRFGEAFNREITDIVLVDFASLKLSDSKSGTRRGEARLMQIINKSMDIKTGKVQLSLVDTNFSNNTRYCLISPSSYIKTGISTTQFIIDPSFNEPYGANEYKKWDRFGQINIVVRSIDGVTRYGISRIQSNAGNTFTLQTPLSFVPQTGDIITFTPYNLANAAQKLVYGFMRNTAPFDDGDGLYQMS